MYNCEKLVCAENHPYLIGLLRLLTNLHQYLHNEWLTNPKGKEKSKPLVLIGEFGEELRGNVGINVQLCNTDKHEDSDKDRNRDYVDSNDENEENERKECNCRVWCVQCNDYVHISEADFKLFGPDHALYCVCRTCTKSTPEDILQGRLKQLYEVGIEVKVLAE
jgi:hypothetical protein